MKYFFSFIILAGLSIAFSATVQAQVDSTRVRGNIYDMANGGQGIGGLTVNVNCNGHIQNKVTDSFGLYVADFPSSQCDKFQAVTSIVTFKGETQSQTVFVSHRNTATLDFYYGLTSVPEFGAIPGIVAAIGSGVAYLGLKKRFSH